jgi:hypothetical protein
MCENIVGSDMSQMTIWRMCIACWVPKATDTHLEYVILIAFPLTMVARTHLIVTPYVHCLACLSFSATWDVGRRRFVCWWHLRPAAILHTTLSSLFFLILSPVHPCPGGGRGRSQKNCVTWARSAQHKASSRGPTAVHAFGQEEKSSDSKMALLGTECARNIVGEVV